MSDANQSNTPALDAVEAARKALAEAQERLAAEERKNADRIREEKALKDAQARLAARKAEFEQRKGHMAKLLDEIRKLLPDAGFALDVVEPTLEGAREVGGRVGLQIGQARYLGDVDVALETKYSGSSWSRRTSGLKMVLGSYGNRRAYPQKSDGTFSYAKIAQELADRFNAARAVVQREQRGNRNLAASKAAIAQALGENSLERFGPVQLDPSQHDGSRAYLKLSVTQSFKAERAVELALKIQRMLQEAVAEEKEEKQV